MSNNGRNPRLNLAVRYLMLTALAALLAVQIGGGVWTLVRLSEAQRVRTGIQGHDGSVWDLVSVRDQLGYRVEGVQRGSLGEKAGLRGGDLIVVVNGLKLRDHPEAYFRSVMGGRGGDSVELVWLREGHEHTVSLLLEEREGLPVESGVSRGDGAIAVPSSPWHLYGPYLLPPLLMLVVGAVIGFLRPYDGLAYRVSLLLLVLAQAISIFVERAPVLASWPLWALAGSLGASRLAIYPLALMILHVLAVFPSSSRAGLWLLRRQWLVIPYGVLGVESLIEGIRQIYGTHYLPSQLVRALDLLVPWRYMWLALLALAAFLLVAQRRGARRASRARLGIVEAGFAATVAGGFWVLFLWNSAPFWRAVAAPEGPVLSAILRGIASFVPMLLLCCLPLSLGYAVLARRVFDIRLIIRLGIRYLLLSRGVLVVEGLLVFLILGEAIHYGQRQIGHSVPVVTMIAGGASLLVVVALVRVNRPLMRRIDRRFFRESYNARRVLLALSRQILVLREREEVLRQVGETLLRTLHPARVGFVLRDRGSGEPFLAWQDAAPSQGTGGSGRTRIGEPRWRIREAEAIRVGLVSLEEGRDWYDVSVGESADTEPERSSGPVFELLVALRGSTGILGCIALAAKLSEEPFGGEDKELLVTVATQTGLALENAELLEVARKEAEHARDLSIARDVQENLFPEKLPQAEGWDFAAVCRPAKAVGGDYYDISAVDSQHVVLALGDVSGKGLGPSLLMSGVHAIIRNRLRGRPFELPQVVAQLNEHLLTSSSSEMFMTLFVGILDVADGRLRYVNAGHNPPLLLQNASVSELTDGGTVIGMMPGVSYAEGEAFMDPGSLLALYSDGVTEAANAAGDVFGEAMLREELQKALTHEASGVVAMVLESVDGFSGSCEQTDDISLVVVKRLR